MLNVLSVSFAAPISAAETTKQNSNSDYGLPTHRRDGGSRGINHSCVSNSNSNLVALIPEETVGINASTSPKLFFYVPKLKQQKTLEFVLRNEQDELMYEAFLTTQGEGIMSVDIPSDVQTNLIEKDTNYHWYLSMICNSQQRSRDIVVEGWMRQSAIDVATKQELDTVDSVAQAELYYEEGFWYDALSVLARDIPSEKEETIVKAKWSELLESVGLKELASAPFIESELIESSVKK
ncbi:MAG: DUF928 domain-containing protein [Pleurocapsa sp.]